jgi:5-methylcytosine-specific restriction endonuclease McrA
MRNLAIITVILLGVSIMTWVQKYDEAAVVAAYQIYRDDSSVTLVEIATRFGFDCVSGMFSRWRRNGWSTRVRNPVVHNDSTVIAAYSVYQSYPERSVRQIAKQFNLTSGGTMVSLFRRHGFPLSRQPVCVPKYTEEQARQSYAYYQTHSDESIAEVARHCGYSWPTKMYGWWSKLGLKHSRKVERQLDWDDKEQVKAYLKQLQSENPERWREFERLRRQRRRARERNGVADISTEDARAILACGCLFCGSKENLRLAHDQAVSKGGNTTRGNLFCLCHRCNSKMGTKMLHEMLTQLPLA